MRSRPCGCRGGECWRSSSTRSSRSRRWTRSASTRPGRSRRRRCGSSRSCPRPSVSEESLRGALGDARGERLGAQPHPAGDCRRLPARAPDAARRGPVLEPAALERGRAAPSGASTSVRPERLPLGELAASAPRSASAKGGACSRSPAAGSRYRRSGRAAAGGPGAARSRRSRRGAASGSARRRSRSCVARGSR